MISYSGYNLKRKIASLAPISVDVFDRIATKLQVGADSTAKLGEVKESDSLDTQPRRADFQRDYSPARCLFCNFDSLTLDDNVDHMFKVHGLFIPNQEDLEDAEGLLSYLFNVIFEYHECLYCGKTKETVEGIRSHMIDKGHCKIAFDEELDQFYDFEGESDNGAEEELVSEDREHVDTEETSTPNEHDFHPDNDHELRLPSGLTLGHRSLSRYYRQNLRSYPTAAERATTNRAITAAEATSNDDDNDDNTPTPNNNNHHPGRQLATRARGEMGMIGVGEFERRALRAREKKALKLEERVKSEWEWRVNKEANHQKHYRVS